MWLAPAALLAVIALHGLHVTWADGSETAVIAGTEETQKDGVESVPEPVEQPKTDDLNKENSKTGKTETSPKEKSPEELSETSQLPPHKERPKRSSESDSNSDDEVTLKSDDSSDQDNSSSGKSNSNKLKYIYSGNKKEGYNILQVKSSKESSIDEKSSEKHHNHLLNQYYTRTRRDASDDSDDDDSDYDDNKFTLNYKLKSSFTEKKLKKSSDNSDDDSNSSDKDKRDKKDKSGSDNSDSDESGDIRKQWTHRPPQVPHWQGHQRQHFSHFRYRRDVSDEEESEEELEKEKEVEKIIVKLESEKEYEHNEDDQNEKDSNESPNENNDESSSSPEEQSNKKHRPPPPRHQVLNPSKAPKPRHRRESSSSEEEKAKALMKEVEDDVNGLINYDAGDQEKLEGKLEVLTSTKDIGDIEQKTVIVLEEKKCSNNKCSGHKKHDEKVPGNKRPSVIGKWFTSIKGKFMGDSSEKSDSESNSSSGESHIKKLEFPPKHSE